MPLIAIVFLPFLYDFFTLIAFHNYIGMWLLVLLVGWRIGRFVDIGLDYQKRTETVENIIRAAQQQSGSKFQLSYEDYTSCMKNADWSLAMETILRSTVINPDHLVTVAIYDDFITGDNQNRLNDSNFMFSSGDIRNNTQVNTAYFRIQPGPYKKLAPVCK